MACFLNFAYFENCIKKRPIIESNNYGTISPEQLSRNNTSFYSHHYWGVLLTVAFVVVEQIQVYEIFMDVLLLFMLVSSFFFSRRTARVKVPPNTGWRPRLFFFSKCCQHQSLASITLGGNTASVQ